MHLDVKLDRGCDVVEFTCSFDMEFAENFGDLHLHLTASHHPLDWNALNSSHL
jgi:hypothetical protein